METNKYDQRRILVSRAIDFNLMLLHGVDIQGLEKSQAWVRAVDKVELTQNDVKFRFKSGKLKVVPRGNFGIQFPEVGKCNLYKIAPAENTLLQVWEVGGEI